MLISSAGIGYLIFDANGTTSSKGPHVFARRPAWLLADGTVAFKALIG